MLALRRFDQQISCFCAAACACRLQPRWQPACLAVVAIAAVVRTDAFGYASGLWQDVRDVLDCGKTDLGFARLVHFLALAYIVYHSGLTGLMRRTRAFLPLCLIGRYGLPVFATGTVLSAMGEVVEPRSEAFSHEVAFGAAIVVGGIVMHYLVARGLAAWRDKSRAQQSMMNRAHTLQMASPLPLRKTAIVLWSGTSRPVSHITSTLRPFKNLKRWHADIAVRPSASA